MSVLFAAAPAAHAEGSYVPGFGTDPASRTYFCIQSQCSDLVTPKAGSGYSTDANICAYVYYDASCTCTLKSDGSITLEGVCVVW